MFRNFLLLWNSCWVRLKSLKPGILFCIVIKQLLLSKPVHEDNNLLQPTVIQRYAASGSGGSHLLIVSLLYVDLLEEILHIAEDSGMSSRTYL